jgi:hypothetical protein
MNACKYLSTLKIFPTFLSLTTLSILASLPALAYESSPFSTQNSELLAQADSAGTTTSGETPTTIKAPTIKPPVVSPPTATPPVVAPNPKGETSQTEENSPDATPSPADATPPTGETPTVPAKESSPTPPTTAPAAPEQPTSSTEAPGVDAAQPGSDQATPLKITETELKQFATAIPPLSAIEKTTKGEVDQVIGQSGLSKDKFIALSKTPTVEATPAEKKSFEQAMTKIQAIEQKAQTEQEKIIRAKGFEPQRFTEILAAVRQDPNLRTKVQQMLPPQ